MTSIFKITGIKPLFEIIDMRDKKSSADFFTIYKKNAGVITFADSKEVG